MFIDEYEDELEEFKKYVHLFLYVESIASDGNSYSLLGANACKIPKHEAVACFV